VAERLAYRPSRAREGRPATKVLITGATGFVGCHTAAALARAGHELNLLVRSRERVRPALEPLGVGEVEVATGDVTDAAAVEAALRGCDAVVHCASVYSLDRRAGAEMKRTNVRGTDTVLGAAHRLGLDPIVHVSSVAALIGERGATLGPDSGPGMPRTVYSRSKADSEQVARRYQDAGAPVVITYPSAVFGPHDPHAGEQCRIADAVLRDYWRFAPPGSIWISDVRDVARLHAAVMERGRGPRRYIALTHNLSLNELLGAVGGVTGRAFRTTRVPLWSLEYPLLLADALQLLLPFRLPLNHESVYIGALNHRVDDSATRRELGLEPRDLKETLADALRWMVDAGHLSRKLVGALA